MRPPATRKATEEQEEEAQGNGERIWPGTRDKATRRGIGQGTHKNEPGDNKQAEYVNKIGKQGRQQDAKTITCKDNNGTHKNGPGDIKQAEYANRIGKEDWHQDAKTITCKDNNTKDTTAGDTNAKDRYKRPTEEQEKENEGSQGGGEKNKDRGAGPGGKEKGSTAKGASGSNTDPRSGAGWHEEGHGSRGRCKEQHRGPRSGARRGGEEQGRRGRHGEQHKGRTHHPPPTDLQMVPANLPQILRTEHAHLPRPQAGQKGLRPRKGGHEDDNGKTINAQDNNAKHIDAKDNKGGNSYPLGDPRPEEAPDFDYGTVVQSKGADGSIVHPLNVMDKALHSQHLEDDKNVTAEDIAAKDPAKKLAKDPAKKKFTKTLTEERAKDLNARKFTKTLAEKLSNDNNGSDSYPLVDPRPEEAPNFRLRHSRAEHSCRQFHSATPKRDG